MELIKITEKNGQQLVSARDLHTYLEASERFSTWFERQKGYGFEENSDYVGCKFFNTLANKELTDYALTLECAKEISMLQRSEKGKQARTYFIECEKKLKNQVVDLSNPDTVLQIVQNWKAETEKNKLLEEKIQLQQPKVEFFDQVVGSDTCFDMADVAKVCNLGIGRNTLFQFLRDNKVLRDNNTPFQQFIDCGYFRVIESKYNKPDGSVNISLKTVVYQKGIDFIIKRFVGRKLNVA